MRDRNTIERIRSLIKSYQGSSDTAFVSEYRKAVEDGSRNGSLTEEEILLLDEIRLTLENWYAATSAPKGDVIGDWLRLVERGKDRLPSSLFETLLARLPEKAARSVDWSPLVLERADRVLLTSLVSGKVLTAADMIGVAKAHPAEFYRSAGLDVLLERRGCPPRAIWAQLADREERSAGLLQGPEALAEAFAFDRSADAPAWFVSFLATNASIRQAVLMQILRDPAALEKLVRYIGVASRGSKGKKKQDVEEAIDAVVRDLLDLCLQAVEEGRRTARSATWAVGMLAVAAHSPAAPMPRNTAKVVEETTGRVARPRMLSALRAADSQLALDSLPVVVPGRHLHETVQEYLHNLPTGGGADSEPAERAARYQRHVGRKEVVQELLPLLQSQDEPVVPRSALDAALFNVGLRPLGVSEGPDTFDSHRHEPVVPGIIPGDQVRIVRPGWQLGDDEAAVVLEKARVKPHR